MIKKEEIIYDVYGMGFSWGFFISLMKHNYRGYEVWSAKKAAKAPVFQRVSKIQRVF